MLPAHGDRRSQLLDFWRERWSDLVDFDVFPVIKSNQAATRVGVARKGVGDSLLERQGVEDRPAAGREETRWSVGDDGEDISV